MMDNFLATTWAFAGMILYVKLKFGKYSKHSRYRGHCDVSRSVELFFFCLCIIIIIIYFIPHNNLKKVNFVLRI